MDDTAEDRKAIQTLINQVVFYPLKDFDAISQIGMSTNVLVASAALGVKSLNDLVALAKAQPGKLIHASSAVGSAIAVRRAVDIATEGSVIKSGALSCGAPASATIDNVGAVTSLTCRDEASKLDYRRYLVAAGKENVFVEGLAGYDPALRLALASIVNNKVQPGNNPAPKPEER